MAMTDYNGGGEQVQGITTQISLSIVSFSPPPPPPPPAASLMPYRDSFIWVGTCFFLLETSDHMLAPPQPSSPFLSSPLLSSPLGKL